MTGPSRHLSWNELACTNHQASPFGRFAPGELVAPYPQEWRETRAVQLADTFEVLRQLLGNSAITVNSAYRTPAYNRLVGGVASSQHTQGRALDITHGKIAPRDLFTAILELQQTGRLPLLGGLGSYQSFVHIDIRPRIGSRIARWVY